MSAPEVGRVYDRGYRPYDGPIGGRREATVALWRWSVRRALGIRRSWRQKLFPWLLLAIVSVPAVVNVGIAYVTRGTDAVDVSIITYRDYVGVSTALLVFVALTAPDVICPDRRNRVLPLIFARPLTGLDYVVAKLGAIGAVVFAFGMLPQILLFVGQMLVSDSSLTYLTGHLDVLWKVPVSVAILAVYYSSVAVAIASLTTRRLVAAAGFLLLLLVWSAIANSVVAASMSDQSLMAALDLLDLPLYLRDVVFLGGMHPDSLAPDTGAAIVVLVATYLVVVGASWITLARRYHWIDR